MDTPPRARSNPLLAFVRFLGVAGWTTFCLLAFLLTRWRAREPGRLDAHAALWMHRWARRVCPIVGITVRVEGSPPKGPVFLAANHVTYADIAALTSAIPCFFVPKSELASWPVIGRLIRLSRQAFVDRRRRASLAQTSARIIELFRAGQNVCVFLESTTTPGDRVLPFRPSLLQPAIDAQVPIVPTAIAWSASPPVHVDDDVAYWKDHVFLPHIARLHGLRGIRAEVRFGTPLAADGCDRKQLAREARRQVLDLLRLPQSD